MQNELLTRTKNQEKVINVTASGYTVARRVSPLNPLELDLEKKNKVIERKLRTHAKLILQASRVWSSHCLADNMIVYQANRSLMTNTVR